MGWNLAGNIRGPAGPPGDGGGGSNFPLFGALPNDVSATSNVMFTTLSDLLVTLAPSTKYLVEVNAMFQTAAQATGILLKTAGTAVLASQALVQLAATSATAVSHGAWNTVGSTQTLGSSAGVNVPGILRLQGVVTTGATGGTFGLQFATEVNLSSCTVKAGSYLQARALT